jgi:uncharacterized protein YjiK
VELADQPLAGRRMLNTFSQTTAFKAWWLGLLLLLFILTAVTRIDRGHAVDGMLALASIGSSAHEQSGARTLSSYRVRIDARPVAGVTANLSGLAHDAERDHLWAVINSPPTLLALDLDGQVISRHALEGFEDVEAVASLGDGKLLLTEERRQRLVIVSAPQPDAGAVSIEGMPRLRIAREDVRNSGLEGTAYDRATDRLFVVKERSPRQLLEIRGIRAALDGRLDIDIIDREAWVASAFPALDFSSVEYDPHSGQLLILSDLSRVLVALDGDGHRTGHQTLIGGTAGLNATVPQAEGVAVDTEGNLYVVSEPNLFYAFSPVRAETP